MNIGHMLQRFVGEAKMTESKAAELKAGQMVRGVLLAMLGDQDALVQIEGVQWKAILHNPGKTGQLAQFLVMPESTGDQPVLKTIDPEANPVRGQASLLKQIGVKDTAENRQTLQFMQREGVSLTKETFQSMKTVLAGRPPELPAETWSQAATAAAHKGLPLTREVTVALHQAMFGSSLDKLVDELGKQASTLSRPSAGMDSPESTRVNQLVTKLQETLAEIQRTVSTGLSKSMMTEGTVMRTSVFTPAPTAAMDGAEPSPLTNQPKATDAAVNNGRGAAISTTATPGESAAPQNPSPVRVQLAGAGGPSSPLQASPIAQEPEAPPVQRTNATRSNNATQSTSESAAAQASPTSQEKSWISRVLQSVGVDLEHGLLQKTMGVEAGQQGRTPPLSTLTQALGETLITTDDSGPADPARGTLGDSVKSILLQLRASDELPPVMRETVQQALQQVMGQQLLLISDRAPNLAHMTLFIPIQPGQDGGRPGSIHIQSRKKGKKGTIDAENCRLIFDLQLNFLGALLIDVQVIDRFVNVVLHNEHPAMKAWVHEGRISFAEALEQLGYRCAQFKCAPFPERPIETDNGNSAESNVKWEHGPKSYKGVDLRI